MKRQLECEEESVAMGSWPGCWRRLDNGSWARSGPAEVAVVATSSSMPLKKLPFKELRGNMLAKQ